MSEIQIIAKLDDILTDYHEKYKDIFKYINPGILKANSKEVVKRFNEENQTINFCRAVQEHCEDAIVWYEYPWRIEGIKEGNKKLSSNRFDAVIYLPKDRTLLIVESKCLRKPSKYNDMRNDLKRICGKDQYTTIQANFPSFNNVYAIILADYWKRKTGNYTKVEESWKTEFDKLKETDVLFKFKSDVNEYLDVLKSNSSPENKFKGFEDYFLFALIGRIKEKPTYRKID